jgi:RimJ/RimL family protein N-acetyltransferase
VVYAVHRVHEITNAAKPKAQLADFIGVVTLKSLSSHSLALPENLTLLHAESSSTLTVELSYMFLPRGWGKGYATESVNAVFDACKRMPSFWTPFSKFYVRAIVNQGNPPSMRVMEKIGMAKRGIYAWTGRIFLAGEWRERDDLHIYGMYINLLE